MVLAGGRGSRLGGQEKGEIRLGGKRLIDIVVDGARSAGCSTVVVVGETEVEGALSVREEPVYGGPVAGLAAALPRVETGWIMLLACDLPHAGLLCRLLAGSFHHLTADFDGLVALTDHRVQWLAGMYRRASVEAALDRIGDPRGTSMRDLLGDLKLREVQDPEGLAHDIDTPEELEAASGGKEDR